MTTATKERTTKTKAKQDQPAIGTITAGSLRKAVARIKAIDSDTLPCTLHAKDGQLRLDTSTANGRTTTLVGTADSEWAESAPFPVLFKMAQAAGSHDITLTRGPSCLMAAYGPAKAELRAVDGAPVPIGPAPAATPVHASMAEFVAALGGAVRFTDSANSVIGHLGIRNGVAWGTDNSTVGRFVYDADRPADADEVNFVFPRDGIALLRLFGDDVAIGTADGRLVLTDASGWATIPLIAAPFPALQGYLPDRWAGMAFEFSSEELLDGLRSMDIFDGDRADRKVTAVFSSAEVEMTAMNHEMGKATAVVPVTIEAGEPCTVELMPSQLVPALDAVKGERIRLRLAKTLTGPSDPDRLEFCCVEADGDANRCVVIAAWVHLD